MIIAGRTSWANTRKSAEGDNEHEELLFINIDRGAVSVLSVMFLHLDFCVTE
jgi:hypothetical protein